MRTIFTIILVVLCSFGLRAQSVFLVEQFDYPAGSQIRDFGWNPHSAGSTNPLLVANTGLSWNLTSYVGSGIGNAVAVNNDGSDENKQLSQSVTSGKVYVSFLMNVPAEVTSTNAGFFFHLGQYNNVSSPVLTSISTAFRARTFVAPGSSAATYKVGLNFNAAAVPTEPEGLSGDLNLNQTYLVVVKYEIIPGADNDLVSLYVFADGANITTEPAQPTIGPLAGTASDLTAVQLVALRQYNPAQNVIVDGIVAQDTWSLQEVIEPTFDCPGISANFGDACDANGSAGIVNNSCVCEALPPQVLLIEQFDYPSNADIQNFGWFAHSAGTTNPLKVTEGGLFWSSTNYIGSGIGNAVAVNNTGSDENKPFSQSVSNGSVYVSFLMNVPEEVTSAGQGYFLHLGEYSNPTSPVFTSVSTAFRARTFVVSGSTPDKYRLGLTFNSATVPSLESDLTAELNVDETYLVVLKYRFIEGANNDLVSLYVFADGADISSEPAVASVGPVGGSAGDISQVQLVALRQYNEEQNIIVDGIVAQTSWSLQNIQEPTFDCPSISANFGDPCTVNSSPGLINQSCQCVAIQPITYLEEQFAYPAGAMIRDFGWVSHSKPTVNPILVSNGGLSLSQTPYIGSGIGNAASVSNTGSNESRAFSQSVTSGSVYLSFLMAVPSEVTPENAGFFLHLGEYADVNQPQLDTISPAFRARTFIAPGSAPNKFKLGLTFNAASVPTSPSNLTADLNLNQTYLVVVKYQILPGANNDLVSLYLFANGANIATEPAIATIGPVSGSARDLAAVQLVALRQYNTNQNIIVDGIFAKNVWAIQDAATCAVNGGTVSSLSPRTGLCVGDGVPNVVAVTVSGNTTPGRFGLVRQSDLAVIATNTTGNFNMEIYPPGNYFAAFAAVEDLASLAGVTNVNQLTGCFDLSNTLTITSLPVSGGTITANGGTTVCTGTLSFSVTGQAGTTFRWALLNQNATQVIAQNTTGVFDFTSLPNATYRVAHVASRGVNLATVVPPSVPPCVSASNLIQVIKSCPSASLESSPNPTTGTSWVTFTTPEETPATLEVFDLSGRKVTELFRQNAMPNAAYRLEFDGNGLPNGVYIYRLTTATDVVVDKFLIAR